MSEINLNAKNARIVSTKVVAAWVVVVATVAKWALAVRAAGEHDDACDAFYLCTYVVYNGPCVSPGKKLAY